MSIACWMGKFQWLVIHYAKVRVILLGAYLQCHQHARMALRSLRSMAWYHLRWLNPLVWISVTGTYCRNNCSCTAFTSEIQDGQTRCHLYYGNRNDLWTSKRKEEGSFTSEEDMHGTSEHGYLEYTKRTKRIRCEIFYMFRLFQSHEGDNNIKNTSYVWLIIIIILVYIFLW